MRPPEKPAFSNQMEKIHDGLTRRQAEAFGLVLSSMAVGYRVVRTSDGWQIWVPKETTVEAATATKAYQSENNDLAENNYPAENDDPEKMYRSAAWPVTRTWAGAWMVLILMAVHLAVNMSGKVAVFHRIFGASASNILNGELYRIITALMLHADALHLIGNMVGMALFATAVCSTAGFGAGSLMILVSGMAGNLVNALLFETGHHSIGASTAVFGAVGIAATHQFVLKWQNSEQRLKAWLPLGGGLALLALLGASINSDLTAHFFGYVAGCFIGIVFTSTRQAPPDRPVQYTCLLAATMLILASYLSPIVF